MSRTSRPLLPLSSKSTLAHVRAGRPGYTVTQGQVLYKGRDLLAMSAEARAREGVFLAFQYPVEIPGVSNVYFLKAALNAVRKHRGLPELDAINARVRAALGEELFARFWGEGRSLGLSEACKCAMELAEPGVNPRGG